MKGIRNIKLRTYCLNATDLALSQSHNPLKKTVVVHASRQSTAKFLSAYKGPVEQDYQHPSVRFLSKYHSLFMSLHRVFFDKNPPGWLTSSNSLSLYTLPHPSKSTFLPWEQSSKDAIQAIREITTKSSYWEKVSSFFSEENHENDIVQDNVSCVKSICRYHSIMEYSN